MKSAAFRLKSRIEWHSSLRSLGYGTGVLGTSVATVVIAVTHIIKDDTAPV